MAMNLAEQLFYGKKIWEVKINFLNINTLLKIPLLTIALNCFKIGLVLKIEKVFMTTLTQVKNYLTYESPLQVSDTESHISYIN